MFLLNLIRKIIKRIHYVFYINPKKRILRKASYHSLNVNPSFLRISSEPYISGDTFRKNADHVFDETTSLNPSNIKNNDVVFLKTDLKKVYFSEFHHKINSRYILLTHNSDISINEKDLNYLDDKIIHWFAMKLNVKMNEKISPLPSGFENRRYLTNGNIRNYDKVFNKNQSATDNKKINKIFCSFNENTNFNERKPLLNIVKSREDVSIKTFTNNLDYINNLSLHKYNLCPEGNDFESHRIWETLFFNNIPIVKSNNVNLNFINLGVPLIMLNNWNDINNLNIQNLVNEFLYNKLEDPRKFVNFEFWHELISQKKI